MITSIVSLDSKYHLMLLGLGLFHATYNIISMTVILSMFSPIQHALLNVAKRVTVVLAFFLVTFTTANQVSPINIISARSF